MGKNLDKSGEEFWNCGKIYTPGNRWSYKIMTKRSNNDLKFTFVMKKKKKINIVDPTI